jgi:6-pyruvoyltetrahydropterin/6-carboxytetrahydropterin synthase
MNKCEKCGAQATVHITRVEAGTPRFVHLCEKCAAADQKATFKSKFAAESLLAQRIAAKGQVLRQKLEEVKKLRDRNRFCIHINARFPASHQLRMYDGSLESLHEHDWRVKVTVSGELDAIGVVMDFHDLEKRLENVIGPMRGRSLNELPAFASRNPSAENIAALIGTTLSVPETVQVRVVEVWETPENSAEFILPYSIDSSRNEK